MMSIPDRIVLDPEICGGKPTIKGTRVLVSVILDYVEERISPEDIVDAFPSITKDDIKASIRYARMLVEGIHFDSYQGSKIHS